MLFVLRDLNPKRQETLGEYYIRTNRHLIPKSVEVWEFEMETHSAKRLHTGGEQHVRPVSSEAAPSAPPDEPST